jgi:hypothetical protein
MPRRKVPPICGSSVVNLEMKLKIKRIIPVSRKHKNKEPRAFCLNGNFNHFLNEKLKMVFINISEQKS